MLIRGQARAAFTKLPPSLRRATLHALGKHAPWEPGFNHQAPEVGAHLVAGPPDFVGVGVQKAGTSWWYSLIAEHPDVYHHEPFHKERHFFDRLFIAEPSSSEVNAYHRWFPRPQGRLTGEWTPDYLHQQWVAPLLHAAAPDTKLLVLLRDPVERFRSGLDHYRERGERLTPMLANDAFVRGLYGAQLIRLERIHPRHRILVLQYEACVDNPRRYLADTFSFLGLDDSFVPHDLRSGVSRTLRPLQLPEFTRHQLCDAYQDDLRLLAASHPELDLNRWSSFTIREQRSREGAFRLGGGVGEHR